MGTDGQQGSRRRSIDSRAADPTKSAAADDDGGSFRRRPRKRKSSIVNNEAHLKSEIPAEEVEETIMFLQSCGSAFRGFEQAEINVLSEAMSVMRFDAGQTVVEQGETGSWFGVLLSGTLRVLLPNNVTITMQPGAIVGEMAVWKEDAIRSASMVARPLHARRAHPALRRADALDVCLGRAGGVRREVRGECGAWA